MGMRYSRNMIAGYPFENSGSDIVGVNNGNVVGATFIDGKIGKCVSFDGVDDYVDYGDVFDLGLESRTVSFWLNIRNHKGTQRYGILGKTRLAGQVGRWYIIGNGSNVEFEIQAVPASPISISIPKSTLSINNWYHVVWVINRVGDMQVYINCQLKSSLGISSFATTNLQTNLPFRIGAYSLASAPYNATLFMDGLIENVKLYNKALIQSEIQRDYLNLPIF